MMDHDDRREYDPYGEMFAEPDHRLHSEDQKVGESGTYPGGEAPQPRTCESCGAQLPDVHGRTKCRHCLEEGVDPLDTDTESVLGSPIAWQFQQVQFAVVPGETKFIAAARGATALKRGVDQTPAIDRVDPIYDFGEDVADVIADRWGGDLPGVTRLDSEQGHRFVAIVRGAHDDTREPPKDVTGIPAFVDATGAAIDPEAALATAAIEADPILDLADDPPVWLMPAWTLKQRGVDLQGTLGSEIAIERRCPRCNRRTAHVYQDTLTVPAPYQSAGIWECVNCRRWTFGPEQDTGRQLMKARKEHKRAQNRGNRPADPLPSNDRPRQVSDISTGQPQGRPPEFPLGAVIEPEVRRDL